MLHSCKHVSVILRLDQEKVLFAKMAFLSCSTLPFLLLQRGWRGLRSLGHDSIHSFSEAAAAARRAASVRKDVGGGGGGARDGGRGRQEEGGGKMMLNA